MKKIRWISLFALLAAACAMVLYAFTPAASPIVIPAEAVVYTDAQAMELFQDAGQWGMTDLLQQEAYLVGDEMNIDFWFSKSAGDGQVDAARSFAITAIVLRQPHFLGTSPYQDLAVNEDIVWKTVSCKVYRGRELLYHERYDERYQLIT